MRPAKFDVVQSANNVHIWNPFTFLVRLGQCFDKMNVAVDISCVHATLRHPGAGETYV